MPPRNDLLPQSEPEKNWQSAKIQGLQNAKVQAAVAFVKEYYWLVTTALLAVVVVLQVVIWSTVGAAKCVPQVGTDDGALALSFPTEVKKWAADYDFVPLNASAFLEQKVSEKWATLLPASALKEFPDDGLVYSSTSVTHQLHCVYIMGKIFSAVFTKAAEIPEPDDYEAHFLHCVDYMRQAAMCAGDLAIEPRGENGQRGPINLETAFNGQHVCKDYGKVQNYLEEQIKEGKRQILPLDD